VAFLVSARRERPSQSPSDRILWILAEHGGKMARSRLRRHAGMRYALLTTILEEMAGEGRIRIEEETITLILPF
jgi:predicted transcriptional regulator